MKVKLMFERDQNECYAKIAGKNYKFTRNEHGDLIAEVGDSVALEFVSMRHNSGFTLYQDPAAIDTKAVKGVNTVEPVHEPRDFETVHEPSTVEPVHGPRDFEPVHGARTVEGEAVEEVKDVKVEGVIYPKDETSK